MGNTVPRRTNREAGAKEKRSRNCSSSVEVEAPPAPAEPRPLATVAQIEPRNNEEREEEEVMTTRAAAGRVVTLKIVMRRKDAEALVARMHSQNARERKARMIELKRELRDGGGASPASWRPRLAPVKENQSYTCM